MVKIELVKRDFVWIGMIVVLLGVGFGYAYGGSDPAVMGHSAGEVEVEVSWGDISGIPADIADGDDVGVSLNCYTTSWSAFTSCLRYPEATPPSCSAGYTFVGIAAETSSDFGCGISYLTKQRVKSRCCK